MQAIYSRRKITLDVTLDNLSTVEKATLFMDLWSNLGFGSKGGADDGSAEDIWNRAVVLAYPSVKPATPKTTIGDLLPAYEAELEANARRDTVKVDTTPVHKAPVQPEGAHARKVAAAETSYLNRGRVKHFVEAVQLLVNEHYKAHLTHSTPPTISVSPGGVKYARIVSTDNMGCTGGSRSVYCFVDLSNGDILKSASWNAPAKHARGNIWATDYGISNCTPYGAKYIK